MFTVGKKTKDHMAACVMIDQLIAVKSKDCD